MKSIGAADLKGLGGADMGSLFRLIYSVLVRHLLWIQKQTVVRTVPVIFQTGYSSNRTVLW